MGAPYFNVIALICILLGLAASTPQQPSDQLSSKSLTEILDIACPKLSNNKDALPHQCDQKDTIIDPMCMIILDYTIRLCHLNSTTNIMDYAKKFECPLHLVPMEHFKNETHNVFENLSKNESCLSDCGGDRKTLCLHLNNLVQLLQSTQSQNLLEKIPAGKAKEDAPVPNIHVERLPPNEDNGSAYVADSAKNETSANAPNQQKSQTAKMAKPGANAEDLNQKIGLVEPSKIQPLVKPEKKPPLKEILPGSPSVPEPARPQGQNKAPSVPPAQLFVPDPAPPQGLKTPTQDQSIDRKKTIPVPIPNEPSGGGKILPSPEESLGPGNEELPQNMDKPALLEDDDEDADELKDEPDGPIPQEIDDEAVQLGNGDWASKNVPEAEKPVSAAKDATVDDTMTLPIQSGDFVGAADSHFFMYFIFFTCVSVMGYIAFHNKNKILALALEGRRGRHERRRPNSAGYRKLDTSLEEAMMSHPSRGNNAHIIY